MSRRLFTTIINNGCHLMIDFPSRFSKVSPWLFLLLGAGLLVGCNSGGNTYNSGGQNVGGPILKPSTVNPLDPDSPATEVALFINQPVKGLSYSCNGVKSTSKFISSDNGSVTGNLPVARCGNNARSITFYLGKKDASGFSHNIELGKLLLPMTTLGSDQKTRFNPSNGSISSATFMFDRSVSDMQSAPSRLDVNNSFDGAGTCKSSRQAACELVYKTALLQALGNTQDDTLVIPPRANTVAANPEKNGHITIPNNFTYSSYKDFKSSWEGYLHAVKPGAIFLSFNAVIARINEGAHRLRAGTYTLDWGGSLGSYKLYYNSCYLYNLLALNSDWLVYPDGTIAGFGYGVSDTKYKPNICPDLSNPNELDSSKSGFLAVSSGALDNSLNLRNVSMTAVDSNQSATLNFFGRFFGEFLYDGREPQLSDKAKTTDFQIDFPTAKTRLADAEKGSVTGQLFDFKLPDYASGNKVTVTENQGSFLPTPFPLRMLKGAALQAAPLAPDVIAKLPDNYAISLLRFCGSNETGCSAIPTSDIGVNGNYPETVCTLSVTDSHGENRCGNTVTIKNETAKRNIATDTSNADSDVYLHFDTTSIPGNVIIELLDQNQDPVLDPSSGQPMRVGFVTATPKSGSVSDDTVDIHLLFASTNADTMPQLGSALSGRIDLSDGCMPIYRLGDANYAAKIRARWTDSFGYASHVYREQQGIGKKDAPTAAQSERIASLSAGAVQGWNADDASCRPSP